MDGNRGAKGSIKDRLISMLYRLRYAKKVKKEEEYQIAKKEKQVEYLKKLVQLEEKENIEILDTKDKKELDKVKFNVTYKFNDNKLKLNKKDVNKEIKFNKKIVGIDVVDIELKNIEYKTDELDEKVELKKEIRKTKNEVIILKEVNEFINKSKENLKEIKEEVDTLKELSKEKNQNTEKLEERYKKLRVKIEKLKKQYEAVKEKYDLSEFSILESIKLMDNIKEYKSLASLNEMDMMIKVCKKEITKIESVTIEYKETKKVGINIDNIKDDQNKIKIKFNKNKEDIKELNNIEQEINIEIKHQEEIIEDMYKDASYFEKITRTEFNYSGYGKMFSALLNISGGILTLPFTGRSIFGIALGNTMINRGLKTINKGLNIDKKLVYEYKYTDIAHKISEVKDKVEYTSLIIEDNLKEIEKLKENFKKYIEYNNVLPEYESMLKKVDKLEESLKLQQIKISKLDNKLEEERNLNEQKMKKVMMNKDKN